MRRPWKTCRNRTDRNGRKRSRRNDTERDEARTGNLRIGDVRRHECHTRDTKPRLTIPACSTVEKQDPSRIMGSGYIQFPPQRPFERPVQAQPPTLSQLEYPEAYGTGTMPAGQGNPTKYVAPPQATTTRMQQQQQQYTHHAQPTNVQQRTTAPQPAPMRPPMHRVQPTQANHPPTRVLQKNQGYHNSTRPPSQTQPQNQFRVPPPTQKAGPVHSTARPASVQQPAQGNGPTNAIERPAAAQPARPSRPTFEAHVSKVPEPASTPGESTENKAKLSKSQAKRMRKKMRESQGVAGNL